MTRKKKPRRPNEIPGQPLFIGRRLLAVNMQHPEESGNVLMAAGTVVDVVRYETNSRRPLAVVAGDGLVRNNKRSRGLPERVILAVPLDSLVSELQTKHHEEAVAFSSYLTADEWDACYYRLVIAQKIPCTAENLRQVVPELLAAGYRFTGLSETGELRQQLDMAENSPLNRQRLLLFVGNPYGLDTERLLNNGREFLKRHCPILVLETDAEWSRRVTGGRRIAGDS